MKPRMITFTGVDEHTDPVALVQLANDYPGKVEWGILFSPGRAGKETRYPRPEVIEHLVTEHALVYAAHLCGDCAREVVAGGKGRFDDLLAAYFQRAQVNTKDEVDPALIRRWADGAMITPILQCRGDFPQTPGVEYLFDASGGRGIEPKDWPRGLSSYCGYAGGLKPDNVASHVERIGAIAPAFWIDMESGVRSDDDRFSVAKCRSVCEAVYGPPAA